MTDLAGDGVRLAATLTRTAFAEMLDQIARSIGGVTDVAVVGYEDLADLVHGAPPDIPVSVSGAMAGSVLAHRDGWLAVGLRNPSGHGGWRAVLWVHGQLSEPQVDDIRQLALQASVSLVAVLRGEALAMRSRQYLALVEAGKSLSKQHTLETVLSEIIDLAVDLSGARYGALGVLDPSDPSVLSDFITTGLSPDEELKIGDRPTGLGLLGALIREERPIRLGRIQDHPASRGFPEHHPKMTSFLGVPIQTRRATTGRIYLTDKQGATEFSAEDEQLVVTLASQAAIAIENATLYEDLRAAADELEQASRHKSAFLASMSHELRSPLNTILGYTQLLLDDEDALDPEHVEDIRIINASGQHLLGLISDLLDLSKIEAGAITLNPQPVDLRELTEDVVSSLLPQARESNTRLISEAAPGVIVTLDRPRIRQALLNAVGNAVKFTRDGNVRIIVEPLDEDVFIHIEDDGPGIPSDDLARVFDSFFQSAAAMQRTPRSREGAGLGLAITRNFVELHGGHVSIESALDVGTVVHIRLPRGG